MLKKLLVLSAVLSVGFVACGEEESFDIDAQIPRMEDQAAELCQTVRTTCNGEVGTEFITTADDFCQELARASAMADLNHVLSNRDAACAHAMIDRVDCMHTNASCEALDEWVDDLSSAACYKAQDIEDRKCMDLGWYGRIYD